MKEKKLEKRSLEESNLNPQRIAMVIKAYCSQ